MRQPVQNTVKLPRRLLEELGLEKDNNGSRRNQNGPGVRKERRKAARIQKKSANQLSRIRSSEPDLRLRVRENSKDNASRSLQERSQSHHPDNDRAFKQPQNLKSILKKPKSNAQVGQVSKDHDLHLWSSSPASTLPRENSHRLLGEDAEIAALEKALGVKDNGALPKSFTEDGLDSLLGGLGNVRADELTLGSKRKRTEGEEWLEKKRRKARNFDSKAQARGDEKNNKVDSNLVEEYPSDANCSDGSDEEETDSFDLSSKNSPSPDLPSRKIRENPYTAPIMLSNTNEPRKYLPPSLRNQTSSNPEGLSYLRRQIQGLLNRISEANIISILGETEKLYRNNPRQHVSATVLDLLMGLICDTASLQDTFVILHAGFIAAMYKVIGMDFGAQAIQRIYEEFVARYSLEIEQGNTSKISTNLISLFTELYNYQVIDSTLIYDLIRLFLEDFTENSAEIVMRIMRNSSSQLRHDGASSLKDIIGLLQSATAKIGEDNLSVRTKFMIETMNNLKDNRVKTGIAASTVASEHRLRMKKTLGSLNMQRIRAGEPLRIGLKDMRNSDKRGKWWLIGASYKDEDRDNEESGNLKQNDQGHSNSKDSELLVGNTSDLVQLAREQRMNTDVRRSIFVAIMSATDFKDAHSRLQKLHLKKTQELEIPKVLIHCAAAEKSYNPFYTLVARRICSDRKLKFAFQFSLWNLFKQMGEDRNDHEEPDSEDKDTLGLRSIVNLAKFFGVLIAEDGLGIGVLKTLDFVLLQSKTKTFIELLLITTILHSQQGLESKRDEKALMRIFLKSKDVPNLARGLQYFLKRVVSKTDVAGTKQDFKTVRWGCKVAFDALTMIASSAILNEDSMGI